MKIKVGVSNRHVHLTKETYEYLFGNKKLEVRNYLSQPDEFASLDTVDIRYNGKIIEHVRIVGPFREQNQIELLNSDLKYLNLEAPTRRSGLLEGTPKIELVANGKTKESDGVIKAEIHIHIPKDSQKKLGFNERDKVLINYCNHEFYAYIKICNKGVPEIHIDKDEAELFGIKNGDEVEVKSCGE